MHSVDLAEGAVPMQAEPLHVFANAVGERLGRALGIRIVEAQNELTAGLAHQQPIQQRDAGVADMQVPGR